MVASLIPGTRKCFTLDPLVWCFRRFFDFGNKADEAAGISAEIEVRTFVLGTYENAPGKKGDAPARAGATSVPADDTPIVDTDATTPKDDAPTQKGDAPG